MSVTGKLILGTVQLGLAYGVNNTSGMPSADDAIKILKAAYDFGIRTLDTAEAYGYSQQRIGKYHTLHPNKKFNVITKFTGKLDNRNIVEHVQKDLADLSVEKLKAYMFHSFAVYQSAQEILTGLIDLRSKRIIEQIGVSVYTNDQLATVIADERVDLIQMPFNLLDNNHQRGELMRLAKKSGKEIHIRSIFLQGLFFKEREALPKKLAPLKPYLIEIDELANKTGISIESMAIGYADAQKTIDYILVGVDSVDQLRKNIKAFEESRVEPGILSSIDNIAVKEIDLLNPANWS